jgi:hypothetical protein
MALNPDFTQQTTRILPFCLGWVYVQGIKMQSMFGLSNLSATVGAAAFPSGTVQIPAEVEMYVLGDGEWDSVYMFSTAANQQLLNTDTFAGGEPIYRPNPLINNSLLPTIANRALYMHFHGGAYATIGMPNNLASFGPDCATDEWLNYLPTITPALAYSNLAYLFVRGASLTGSAPTLTPVGVYRSTRCRIFDDAGNVTGYGFTTNPTWQMIETLLRFQIKPQQPALAGLTSAEVACFDWPAIAAHAARNSFTLPNGAPRFVGNFAFAADSALDAMMETQLRNCLSYKRVRGGKISFSGEEERSSVFTFSKQNMMGGSLKLGKKNLRGVANIYVPQYRDLGIPAISQVVSVTTVAPIPGFTYTSMFNTISPQPFAPNDFFVYGGSSDDSVWAGTYAAGGSVTVLNGVDYPIVYVVPNQLPVAGGPQAAATATGGYLGTQQSRFASRAPECVQHRSAQKAASQVAPGLTIIATQLKVFYDLGNNTFDQTNRVCKFLIARDLGTDGPDWIAPLKGSIAGFLEAVDVNDAALLEVEPGDVITIDSTADADFGVGSVNNPAGLFEVVGPLETTCPSVQGSSPAKRTLNIQTYNPNAFTDVSDDPGASFLTVPGQALPMGDLLPENTPFWLLQSTPEATYDGPTGTITVPDCSIMWMGQTTPTLYPTFSLSGIPVGSVVTIYLNVTNQATTPTLTLDTTSLFPGYPAGSSLEAPPSPLPYGQIVLFYGTFTDVTSFSEVVVTGGFIGADSAQFLPLASGGATGLVFTPSPATVIPLQNF